MKKLIIVLMLSIAALRPEPAKAQLGIAEIIKAGVTKVIKAMDLRIQRLQNKTIWLQNAQKTLENAMSKLKLEEISEWTERQKDLYKDYFEELRKVKSMIAYYHRIKDISARQAELFKAYQQAWGLLRQDRNFKPDELGYMEKVYSGILEASLKNIDQLTMIASSFQTQMTDAKRLELIRKAAEEMDANYFDLLRFNQQNILLSLSRAKDLEDTKQIKKLYGIQ